MVAYAAQNTNKHGQTPLGPYSAGANALPCFDNTSVTRASTAEIGMHYCDQLLHGYHSLHLAKMNATATPKSSDRSSADIITELTCGLSGAHIIATAGIRHREAMRTATLDDHLIAPSSYDSAEQHQPKISLWKRSSGNTSRPGTLYPYQHSGLVSLLFYMHTRFYIFYQLAPRSSFGSSCSLDKHCLQQDSPDFLQSSRCNSTVLQQT